MGRKRTSEVTCDNCGSRFTKEDTEIRRRQKSNGLMFCCYSCSATYKMEQKYGDHRLMSCYLNNAQKRALKKNMDFNLDADYLLQLLKDQKGLCSMTGLSMTLNLRKTKSHDKSPYYASLDRIDNTQGYIKGNVRFVCLAANYMRNTFTAEHIEEWLTKVVSSLSVNSSSVSSMRC